MMDLKSEIEDICKSAKNASRWMAQLGTDKKNEVLLRVGKSILDNMDYILAENARDVENAKINGMKPALIDRLQLNEGRIRAMVEGINQVVALDDPIGNVTDMKKRPNGLKIGSMVVPIGVVAIIYEARPNVTADAFALCFKAGNSCILRGGSDAICSNAAIAKVCRSAIEGEGGNPDCIRLIGDVSHESVNLLLHMNGCVDVIIPRGGAGLIKNVVENSTVPVIETGTGNCHIYVDEFADIDMAVEIINNAKTQRIGVCNACESLVIHSAVIEKALPLIVDRLKESNVEVRGDERALKADPRVVAANDDDWGKEYLDYIISVRTVDSLEEAIRHINEYNTGHSEAIVTKDYANAQRFLDGVDAAAVYVNASTRFTDGFEFGFGAEIGISTQKLHARGPMGLKSLTTTKYIVYGEGQIRK